jgi:hypothetical protein
MTEEPTVPVPTPSHRAPTDESQQRPFTAVPATRSSKRVLRIKQNVLIGAVVAGFLLGPLAFLVASRSSSAVEQVRADLPAPLPTSTAGFAEIVARDFVAGRPTQLPTAEGVPATLGFDPRTRNPLDRATLFFDGVFGGNVAGTPVSITRFRVVVPANDPQAEVGYLVYNLSITTMKDPTGRFDVLAALPYLSPAVFAGQIPAAPAADETVPGGSETIPPPVVNLIDRWGRAYAEGSQEQMRTVVRPPNASATFPLLTGAQLAAAPTIPWMIERSDGSAIVRARFVFSDVSANGFTPSIELDFLVSDVNGQNPEVKAWGAPGSGPTLEPNQNTIN